MSILSNVDHLRIETIFQPDHVCHPEYVSDPQQGIRRTRIERRWYRKNFLGSGMFGDVFLEEELTDTRRLRAVKIIRKAQMLRFEVDYTRELNALANFSTPKVWYLPCSHIRSLKVFPSTHKSRASNNPLFFEADLRDPNFLDLTYGSIKAKRSLLTSLGGMTTVRSSI
jgi:hypothetical protein